MLLFYIFVLYFCCHLITGFPYEKRSEKQFSNIEALFVRPTDPHTHVRHVHLVLFRRALNGQAVWDYSMAMAIRMGLASLWSVGIFHSAVLSNVDMGTIEREFTTCSFAADSHERRGG